MTFSHIIVLSTKLI